MINKNEPASLIGSKLNLFLGDDESVQMGRFRSDTQLNIYTSIFSAAVPVILLFLTRSFKEFEETSGSSKALIFLELSLDLGISFRISLLISSF